MSAAAPSHGRITCPFIWRDTSQGFFYKLTRIPSSQASKVFNSSGYKRKADDMALFQYKPCRLVYKRNFGMKFLCSFVWRMVRVGVNTMDYRLMIHVKPSNGAFIMKSPLTENFLHTSWKIWESYFCICHPPSAWLFISNHLQLTKWFVGAFL